MMWKNKKFLYGLLVGAILMVICGISVGFVFYNDGPLSDYPCNCEQVLKVICEEGYVWLTPEPGSGLGGFCPNPTHEWVKECDTCYR